MKRLSDLLLVVALVCLCTNGILTSINSSRFRARVTALEQKVKEAPTNDIPRFQVSMKAPSADELYVATNAVHYDYVVWENPLMMRAGIRSNKLEIISRSCAWDGFEVEVSSNTVIYGVSNGMIVLEKITNSTP